MSLFDDLAEIFRDYAEDENDFNKLYLGWQCPICKTVYNPHLMNCVKDHKKGNNEGPNYPLQLRS